MPTFMVRYGEISLKGNNRRTFVSQLSTNIRRSLQLADCQVTAQMGQLLVSVPASQTEEAREHLSKTFGIAWFAQVSSVANNIDRIGNEVVRLSQERLYSPLTFAIRAKRSTKSVPFTSDEICRYIGDRLRVHTGATVNLDTPDMTIHIAIHNTNSFIFTEKIPGPGGLPVGTSGRVLSLVSGGFDSIASSYLLAKRGANVDFLHFHVFPTVAGLLGSKMPALWETLSRWTLSDQTYSVDYTPFQMALLGQHERFAKYELIAFRRLMIRVGEALARSQGYDALALGDSLGQVASQTMDNIVAVDDVVAIPIFRPLIGMDKLEIISLVREIGLEDHAIAPYKDCCSIVAKHPGTRADLQRVREFEHHIGAERLVDAILANINIIPIANGVDSIANPDYRTIKLDAVQSATQ